MSNKWQMYDSMRSMTEKYNNLVDQVNYTLEVVHEATNGGSIITIPSVIPVGAWELDPDINGFHADVDCEPSTPDLVPQVSILPTSMDTVRDCGMMSSVQTLNGVVRFYSSKKPLNNIAIQITLLLPKDYLSDLNVPSPEVQEYDLPVATAYRLGGVKIGSNMSITADGVLNMDRTQILNAIVASDNDVKDMIDDVFGENTH